MKSQRHSYLISLGHICTDINQGALPALLPFLIAAYDLSYALAAVVMLANSVASALIQPLFGYMGDKINRPWFMSVGILMAASGVSAMGFFKSYGMIIACALITGVGVALFHPEGAKLANVVAGEKKGAGVSNFSIGGNIGMGVGPIVATFALSTWGMQGTLIFLVPAVIGASILFSQTKSYRRLTEMEVERIREAKQDTRSDDWVGFLKVTSVNTVRSIISYSFMIFIPLYWVAVLGQSQASGSLMLTVYALGGAVATFIGGRIADVFGFKRIIMLSCSLLAPLLVVFVLTSNVMIATVLVLVCALINALANAPMVVMGQSYLPNRIGFASGISLGVVVSIGGMVSPGIGAIGDTWGLNVSMWVVAALAFVALGLATTLFMGRSAHDGVGAHPQKSSQKAESSP